MKVVWGLLLTAAGVSGGEVRFTPQTIDEDIAVGYGLAIADVDGDGRSDILLCESRHIYWYRNPDWKRHLMSGTLTERDHVCLAAQDIDGDGRAEIAVGAGWNPGNTVDSGSVHYLLAPEDRTAKWNGVALHHEPTVHRMHWIRDESNRWRLAVLPLHGRGNRGGRGEGVRLLAYDVPDDPRGSWNTLLLDGDLHMTHNFDPVQWDDDPATELLVAAREGVFLVDPGRKRVVIGDDSGGGAGEVRRGSLGEGRPFVVSIEPMHGRSVVVYRPSAGAGPWRREVIDESLQDGHALACGDLLGLGRDQVVAGWRAMRGGPVGISLYLPDASGSKWTRRPIDEGTMACEDLRLADLDGDGRLDIVAAGRRTSNVIVYWNRESSP